MIEQGVGARHKETKKPVEVVGYQDIYTKTDFLKKKPEDVRLSELREIGLSKEWLDLASSIGFDAFMIVWWHLDMVAADKTGKGSVFVPAFRNWFRFQRNRVIISLKADGLAVKDIKAKIKNEIGEDVSLSHISRVFRSSKCK